MGTNWTLQEDLEWYDPAQVTTGGGHLQLTLEKIDDPENNHNLNYRSGMVASVSFVCDLYIKLCYRYNHGQEAVPNLDTLTQANLTLGTNSVSLVGLSRVCCYISLAECNV